MATRTNNNRTYYINPETLTFVENSGHGANLIRVSASSSCRITVYDPSHGITYNDGDRNYRRWTVTAYNNKFPDNGAYYIYVRLEKEGSAALVVYSKVLYEVDGSAEGIPASTLYYYIRIGEVSSTDGTSIRDIIYDTGYLESDQGYEDSLGPGEMWEIDKHSTPWLIKAKHWLSGFTVKGFISLVGGFVFKNGEQEKPVSDIKRSTDSDEDVPVSDENLATSRYVESKLEDLDERFLSKVKPDETPHHIKLLGGLTTTEAASDDYAKDTLKAGWAARKDDDGNWYVEADKIVARILANVYDLLVENNAVFKGNLSSEEFISGFVGGKGWAIRMKEWENAAGEIEKKSLAEFDDLIVRGSMRVYEFIVSQMLGENDNRIFTGMMEVDHYDAADGKVYLKTDGGKLYNPFRVDDVIIVQQYGGNPSEENGYYVTKQYEFVVTEVGVGEQGEDRLDWVRFRNFTTSMEGGSESLITERDTLVRLDNLSNADRKGIIQLMSVGQDTPYMDFIYGAKTDPDNSLKGRLGNLGGVYNPLFGWLQEFGAYLTNLYAVGEFVIAHTGENVADSIEIAKGQFRTNFRQSTYDMSEEQNFLTNASMTNNCEHWTLGADDTEYFLVDGLPQSFNFDLLASEQTYAGLSEWKGRDMLRLNKSSITQWNSLIRKAGTHKVYTGSTENPDGSYTDTYEEVPDTLYLSVRFYVALSGKVEFGFVGSDGKFIDNDFHYSSDVTAREDGYEVKLSGIWDGRGDFSIISTGDVYVDMLSLTDKPLDNFKITTETKIEQDATRISLLGKKINGVEGSVTDLGIELNAAKEEIKLYVDKEVGGVGKGLSELSISVGNITAKVDKINLDAAGNVTNISKSGLVLESNFASLFTNQVTSQGIAKTAEIKTYVNDSIAKIKISADQIDMSANDYISIINKGTTTISASRVDLSGLVTVTSLNSTLTGYATDGELSAAQTALNTSISNLDKTLSTKIDKKASTESLNQKVNELNTAISGKADSSKLKALAYEDVVQAALCGSTLISGGYLNTDYCKVKTIEAIQGTVGGFTIHSDKLTVTTSLERQGFVAPSYLLEMTGQGINVTAGENNEIESQFGVSFFSDVDTNYFTTVNVKNNQSDNQRRHDNVCVVRASLADDDYGLFIEGGSTFIQSSGITKIHGLAVNCSSSTGTAAINVDFISVSSGTVTLPAPYLCPGKIYFVKKSGGSLTVPNFIGAKATVTISTEPKTSFENRPYMFISNGSAWFEFYCCWD
jgi:hypothetical protein